MFSICFTLLLSLQTKQELQSLSSWEARLSKSSELLAGSSVYSSDQLAAAAESFYFKLKIADQYQPKFKYGGDLILIRAKDNYVSLGDDYGLSQVIKYELNFF